MAATSATSLQQPPVPNSGTKETLPAQSSNTLAKRINPLAEPVPSVQFWRSRELAQTSPIVAEKTAIDNVLRSYFSYKTVRDQQGVIQYHVTTSSDEMNADFNSLTYRITSQGTLRIHDPEMKKVIAECALTFPSSNRNRKLGYQLAGLRVGDIKSIRSNDFIFLDTGYFDTFYNKTYKIYRFDRTEQRLEVNFTNISNPIFRGIYLISWFCNGSYAQPYLTYTYHGLNGKNMLEAPLIAEDCNCLWIDERTDQICLGKGNIPKYHFQLFCNGREVTSKTTPEDILADIEKASQSHYDHKVVKNDSLGLRK